MRSFISSFKPYLIAVAIIVTIEAVLALLVWNRHYDTNLLLMSFGRREPVERVLLHEKIQRLGDVEADVVVVGDSSGFYGVQPDILDKEAAGIASVNAAAVARTGYNGFAHIARYMMRRDRPYRALVVHVTPFALPGNHYEDAALEKAIHGELLSMWRHLRPPSNAYRLAVTNLLARQRFENELLPERVGTYWGGTYDVWKKDFPALTASRGWMVRPGGPTPIPESKTPVRLLREKNPYNPKGFDNLLALCREKKVPLVIAFNPVPRQPAGYEDAAGLQKQLDDFARRNPDVHVPFPLVTQWERDAFLDPWHLSASGSDRQSHRIGRALAALLKLSSANDPIHTADKR